MDMKKEQEMHLRAMFKLGFIPRMRISRNRR